MHGADDHERDAVRLHLVPVDHALHGRDVDSSIAYQCTRFKIEIVVDTINSLQSILHIPLFGMEVIPILSHPLQAAEGFSVSAHIVFPVM